VLLATWGSLGDLHPFLVLGRALAARGHAPLVLAPEFYRPNVVAAGLPHRPIRPEVPPLGPARDAIMRRVTDSILGVRYLWRKMLAPAARDTLADTLAVIDAEGADCIVANTTVPGAAIAAETRGIANLTAVLQAIGFFSPADPPAVPQAPWLRTLARRSPRAARAYAAVARRISEPWAEEVHRLRAELGLARRPNYFFEGQFSPEGVLALFSPVLLSPLAELPRNTTVTGFLFGDRDSDADRDRDSDGDRLDPALEAFLAKGAPPVLFTLGSSASSLAGDFYHWALDAAAAIGERAVLVGEERFLPRALPPSTFAAEYAPYGALMPRCAAAVIQGGIGTIAETLRAGRPMVIVPFGSDQPDNAWRCIELGCAVRVRRRHLSARSLAAALREVLGTDSMRQAAERIAARLAAEDGGTRAVEAIERACGATAAAAAQALTAG
jgi:UDP:flavonoid glycosyltransferase YjiC (YdhE family)